MPGRKPYLLWVLLGIILCSLFSLQADETFGVPIPVIGIDPNEGALLGVLLAVITEEDGRISRIMAPVATYNELVGYSADFNFFGFPSDDISYELYFSHTSENFWGYRAEYIHQNFFLEEFLFSAEVTFEKTASSRFYGFGPDADKDNETNYTLRRIHGYASLNAEFIENFHLTLTIRGNRTFIRKGTIDDIDSIEKKFPNVPGIKGGYSLPGQIALEYDTRDSTITPTTGIHGKIFFEIADKSFLSSFSVKRYGAVAKFYFSLGDEGRFTTAFRALVDYQDGDDVPFFELSTLGGGTTLRGFGSGRYYDEHRILCNIEERIRMFRWGIGEIFLDVETALFFDVGQVVSSLRRIARKDLEAVAGGGLRFVVRSQIVAKVDFGYGSEGSEIFAGLDYPF